MTKVKAKMIKKSIKVQKEDSEDNGSSLTYILPLLGLGGGAGAAAGGGGSDSTVPAVTFTVAPPAPATSTPSPAPVTPPTVTDLKTINFKYVDNAFVGNMPLPGKFQLITTVAVIDINKDSRLRKGSG